jgi:hypothetical protein
MFGLADNKRNPVYKSENNFMTGQCGWAFACFFKVFPSVRITVRMGGDGAVKILD